jgi:uncharacterized protein (TIGR02996 family)
MDDNTDFIRAILAAPDDDALRLVYADWLEERGDRKGEYLRLEAALASDKGTAAQRELRRRLDALRKVIDPGWQALLDRTPLGNCRSRGRAGPLPYSLNCPGKWERLQLTENSTVRWCDTCRQQAYSGSRLTIATTWRSPATTCARGVASRSTPTCPARPATSALRALP